MREISSRVISYSKEVHDFGKHDERAWRVLRRVALSRARHYSDECAFILPNNDFRVTAFGG